MIRRICREKIRTKIYYYVEKYICCADFLHICRKSEERMFSPLRRQAQLSATSKIYQNVDFSFPSFLKSFLEYPGYYIENSDLF